jgi:hypothetical protein
MPTGGATGWMMVNWPICEVVVAYRIGSKPSCPRFRIPPTAAADATRVYWRSATSLADAVRYALDRWDALCRFLDDGRIELDTNRVERAIRPVTLGRKNHLFAGSDRGRQCSFLVGDIGSRTASASTAYGGNALPRQPRTQFKGQFPRRLSLASALILIGPETAGAPRPRLSPFAACDLISSQISINRVVRPKAPSRPRSQSSWFATPRNAVDTTTRCTRTKWTNFRVENTGTAQPGTMQSVGRGSAPGQSIRGRMKCRANDSAITS